MDSLILVVIKLMGVLEKVLGKPVLRRRREDSPFAALDQVRDDVSTCDSCTSWPLGSYEPAGPRLSLALKFRSGAFVGGGKGSCQHGQRCQTPVPRDFTHENVLEMEDHRCPVFQLLHIVIKGGIF